MTLQCRGQKAMPGCARFAKLRFIIFSLCEKVYQDSPVSVLFRGEAWKMLFLSAGSFDERKCLNALGFLTFTVTKKW